MDMECQSGEDRDNGCNSDSEREDNGQGHPAIVNVLPPAALPDELAMLIKAYLGNKNRQFSWKIQGGAGQTSVTLIFREITKKNEKKTKSQASKNRDHARSQKNHEETQTNKEDSGTQTEIGKRDQQCQGCPAEETKRRDRSESLKRKRKIEETRKTQQQKETQKSQPPEVDLNESPENARRANGSILISGQPVTMCEQMRAWGRAWNQEGGKAELYICKDKKHKNKKWLLVIDKETKRTVLQEEVAFFRHKAKCTTGDKVWWNVGQDNDGMDINTAIVCEDKAQNFILWEYLRGADTVSVLHKSEVEKLAKEH